VCLELNARALVRSWKVENLDAMNVGWLGIYSPNHHKVVVGRLRSHGAPESGAPDQGTLRLSLALFD
jgi:hypothetical protein